MVVGLLFELQHWPHSYNILFVASLISLSFWAVSIVEVWLYGKPTKQRQFMIFALAAILVIAFFFYVPLLFLLLQSLHLRMVKKRHRAAKLLNNTE